MNYTVVKQFYNSFVDSIYNLIFKIVDFGKMLWETFLAFLELWEIFFSIFFNLFLYIYYLFLFTIDRSLDTNPFPKRGGAKERFTPTSGYRSKAAFGMRGPASSSFSSSIGSGSSGYSRMSRTPRGAKTLFVKDALKGISNFINEIINAITGFFKRITGGMPDIKRGGKGEQDFQQKKGLIDEYLKEYEESRNR